MRAVIIPLVDQTRSVWSLLIVLCFLDRVSSSLPEMNIGMPVYLPLFIHIVDTAPFVLLRETKRFTTYSIHCHSNKLLSNLYSYVPLSTSNR